MKSRAWLRRFLSLCLCGVLIDVSAGQQTRLPEVLPPAAQSDSITLTALKDLALQHNPTLTQASAQVGIARGKAIQAGLYPNPTAGYVAEQIGAEGTAGELQGLFVQQEFVTAGKLAISQGKYTQEIRQAQVQHEAQQYRILSSVRSAFYHTLVTQRQVEVREELLKIAEDAHTTTRGLVNVGQANRADLLQAEVQVRRMRAAVRAAQKKLQGHWHELTAVVGVPEMAFVSLEGDPEIPDHQVLAAEETLQQLLDCSPQLQAAWLEVARDQLAVRRELVEPISNITVRLETGYNFEAQDSVAGVTAGVRLPIFDRNQGSVMQARAELARAQAEISRIELMLRKKFGERFSDYEANLVTARSYEQELLPRAKEAYELYHESFKNRRAAWPQVLVAQREYFQLNDEYLETLLELRDAEAEINGLFLGDGLDQPPAPPPRGHRDATPRPR